MSHQITYKDLKEGDRVKVEIEGVIDAEGYLVDEPDAFYWCIPGSALSQSKITLLEPELKVGRAETVFGHSGRVFHIEGGLAWFRSDDGATDTFLPANDLRNIPEDTDNG